MLFGKKKKKLDARVRFQHSSFTKKLETARKYKRQTKAISDDRKFNFFRAIGLGKWWAKVLAVLVLGGLFYLVYIPNFLFFKTTTVNGADGELQKHVTSLTSSYFQERPFYNPQRNLVFLSGGSLSNYIIERDTRVSKVAVKRSLFKRTLTVTVESKYVSYIVNRSTAIYGLYNDGTVKEAETGDPNNWLNDFPGTLKIKDAQSDGLNLDQQYFSPELMNVVFYLKEHFKEMTTQDISYIDLPKQVHPLPMQFVIHIRKTLPNLPASIADYQIIVDPKMDLQLVLEKLGLLLSQTAPDRYRVLKYIDMRFEEKGFVCLVNAPCAAQPIVAPLPEKPADKPTDAVDAIVDKPTTINQETETND